MTRPPFSLDPDLHHIGLYVPRHFEADQIHRLTDIPGYDPRRRTVIVLPGTRVNFEMPRPALAEMLRGMSGLSQALLKRVGEDPDQMNFGVLVYGHNDEQMISDHYRNALSPDHPRETKAPLPAGTDVHDFVRDFLLPQMGLRDGHRPSVEEACDNMARLTLIAHSFGPAFAEEAGRQFRRELQKEPYYYTQEEADRIASEVVCLAYGNMTDITRSAVPTTDESMHAHLGENATVAPAKHEPGFRTIAFAARLDPLAWETMGRIVEEHIKDGHLPADCDRRYWQERYYMASGCLRRPGLDYPQSAGSVSPPRRYGEHRCLIRVDAPAEGITWTSQSGKPRAMNQQTLDDEAKQLKAALLGLKGNINGLNTQPLCGEHLTPEHDMRTYWQRGNENQHIVRVSDGVVKAALERTPIGQRAIGDSLAQIAQAQPMPYIARAQLQQPASGIQL